MAQISKAEKQKAFQIISIVIVVAVLGLSVYLVNTRQSANLGTNTGQATGGSTPSGTTCINPLSCTIQADAGITLIDQPGQPDYLASDALKKMEEQYQECNQKLDKDSTCSDQYNQFVTDCTNGSRTTGKIKYLCRVDGGQTIGSYNGDCIQFTNVDAATGKGDCKVYDAVRDSSGNWQLKNERYGGCEPYSADGEKPPYYGYAQCSVGCSRTTTASCPKTPITGDPGK